MALLGAKLLLVFVGLAILLILLPVNAFVWSILENYQTDQMRLKDLRVRIITEIISGVKVLKLFCWENSFINKITGFIDFTSGS